MMNKKQSSKRQLGKYVLLIPVILTSLFVFGISKAYDVTRGVELVVDLQPMVEDRVPAEAALVEDTTLLVDSVASKENKITSPKKEVRDSIQKVLEKPLVVIDGVVQEEGLRGKGLDKINPDDIESMTILKDESATSLYGDKGKDGVIMLTMKNTNSPNAGVKRESVLKGSPDVITIRKKEPMTDESAQAEDVQKPLTNVVGFETKTRDGSPTGLMFGDSTSTTFKGRAKEDVLYIIDGEPAEGAAILRVEPDQIESIYVIKDAKTLARYGDKGKDGVIIVKTKK